MLATKLFPLLAKPEVQELILLSGKPPCAVVNGSYRRLSAQVLQDEDIMAVVMAARGQEYAAQLADGAQWDFTVQGVGKVTAAARYDGPLLRMSLRLAAQDAAQQQPKRAARSGESSGSTRAAAPDDTVRTRGSASSQRTPAQDSSGLELESVSPKPRGKGVKPAVQQYEPYDPTLRGEARQEVPAYAPAHDRFAPISEADALAPPAPSSRQEPQARFGPHSQPDALAPSARQDKAPAQLQLDAPSMQRERFAPLSQTDALAATIRHEAPDLSVREQPAPARAAAPRNATTGDALDVLFRRARDMHASDLHVLADRPATLRIAGDLVPQPEQFDPNTLEQLLLPRVPERVRAILERDGSCDFAFDHPDCGRFRANVGRQRTGLKLTARPIGRELPTLEGLGLPESITHALEHHQGLIVITGPTGHGKTTTLAALVNILNHETAHHVITVEDPIEYSHPIAKAVISQREVGTHTKTFAAALKGSLREDPDVIVVGELRDTETVRMALSASETGHLVISTMNTPSAAKAIERLIDLFPPGDQPQVRMTLAGGLRLIISQRLVPSADRKQLVAAAELLPGSTPLWALIRENRTYQIASLQQRGKSIGIIRLDDSLADLVRSGKTTMEIAREYCDSPELLATLVQGRPQVARPDGAAPATPENQNDPETLQKRGVELGKQVLSRAGKLFGGENK
ncbi:MAG TPA: PilT/PilU family type 4a pilus ATPase [Polyangiales bacterium]|nr:PilT/PilU family type 4a pilus ATPase [Polyangiales bacterium]